ncbi:UNVERIFIED_CONTAM: putative germin-like protein 2-2 [Sesamum calycinum]|uniref:Germin-like protein n=1 Tax=Sesamum calycinum TaxID=2727403 RepID=A0AAW2RWD6_9LAMI
MQGPCSSESRRFLLQRATCTWKHQEPLRRSLNLNDCRPSSRAQHSRPVTSPPGFGPEWVRPTSLPPRATEILTVLQGSLEVGFITSYPDNKHLSKVLNQGDAFVVPVGLLHYQRNVGKGNTVVLAAVNSQNAGINVVPKGIFGAKPAINSDYLARAFLLNKNIVEQLQAKF